MKKHTILLGALALAAVPALAWAADDAVPAPAPFAPIPAPVPDRTPVAAPAMPVVPIVAARVEVIPAHATWVERRVTVPPVTAERQVPVYETVKVPVHGTLTYTETQPVAVPQFQRVRDDVSITLWNPFRGFREFDLTLIPRTRDVHVGDAVVAQPVARAQPVVVGEREEQRITGWRTETVVVAPARVETIRELVHVPERWVTVAATGTAPLPGTTQTMTEEEFRVAHPLR
jgi:hypothetical protein